MSFPEKEFNKWTNEKCNFLDKFYGLPNDLQKAARWGYAKGYKDGVEDGATGQLKKWRWKG